MKVGKRFGIDRKVLSSWVVKYARNTVVTVNAGRPALFTEKSLRALKKDLSSETYNVKTAEFIGNMQKEHIKLVTSLTDRAVCSIDPISQRSIKRYMVKIRIN